MFWKRLVVVLLVAVVVGLVLVAGVKITRFYQQAAPVKTVAAEPASGLDVAAKAAVDKAVKAAVDEAVKTATTEAKAEVVKKKDSIERAQEKARQVQPRLRILLVVLLAGLFGFRGWVDCRLREWVSSLIATKPKLAYWMAQLMYGYDAVICWCIVWWIVSPLLSRIAVGIGGWYVFSRGDFPGPVYYHNALTSWAPAVWIWLTLTLGVTFASKAAQSTKEHEGWGWDRAALMTIWVLLALLCMVFISFVGATRQWGREHPKPDAKKAAVAAPAKPKAEAEDSGAKKPSPQPRQGRRLDVPSRDILGGEAFTVFPHGPEQPPNPGGIWAYRRSHHGDRSATK